jgi:hypothetical protein
LINIHRASVEDIHEAIENSRMDVYCSEALIAEALNSSPLVIALRGPDGSLGMILGVDIVHRGVATGWAVTTDSIKKYPIQYTKKVELIVNEAYAHFQLHRIQITVKCRVDLLKWAQHLGFFIEGTMYNFGTDKSDYYLMGRIS